MHIKNIYWTTTLKAHSIVQLEIKSHPSFIKSLGGQAIYHYYYFCISGILCKTEGADVERVGRHSLIPVKHL